MSQPTRFTPEMIETYVNEGYWSDETTLDYFERNKKNKPGTVAIVEGKRSLTWKEAGVVVDNFASIFEGLSLDRDTPVVVQLPNSIEECLIRFALKKIGLLGSYIPVIWGLHELEAVIDVLKPGALVVPSYFRESDLLDNAIEVQKQYSDIEIMVAGADTLCTGYVCLSATIEMAGEPRSSGNIGSGAFGPFEVSKLVVTSGSTGSPKIVERPEQQELMWGKGLSHCLDLSGEDVIGGFVPFSGGPGYFTWAGWLVSGCKLVLSDGFSPEALLPIMEREKITVMMTAPAVLSRILDFSRLCQFDIQFLRVVRTGAANLPQTVAKRAEDMLGCMVLRAGGSMETGSFGQVTTRDPEAIRLGASLGKVMNGGELRVVDPKGVEVLKGSPGELLVRGAGTSSGYYKDWEATVRAWGVLGPKGWFRTGDIATIDVDGNVSLIGRIKEMINRGGMNIFPVELESILAEHPKIKEIAVVGLPDQSLGEVPCACVITENKTDLSLQDVKQFLEIRNVARYKHPSSLVWFSDFPRGQTMRVNRRALGAEALKTLENRN